MTDLMLRRRAMMMETAAPELYPVGTKILSTYIGYSTSPKIAVTNRHQINPTTGVYESYSYNSASEIYVPIDPSYTYRKASRSIPWVSYYDENKNYLSRTTSTNSSGAADIANIPAKARYLRITLGTNDNMWNVEITRTA